MLSLSECMIYCFSLLIYGFIHFFTQKNYQHFNELEKSISILLLLPDSTEGINSLPVLCPRVTHHRVRSALQ